MGLVVVQKHKLNRDEALKRVKGALTDAEVKFRVMLSDVHEEWDGYTGKCSFKVGGSKINATVDVGDDTVVLRGSVPFLLLGMQSVIKKQLAEVAAKILL